MFDATLLQTANVSTSDSPWYVPNLIGRMKDGSNWSNREDPEPFKVRLKILTGREMEKLENESARNYTKATANPIDVGAAIVDEMMSKCILEVEGWRSPSMKRAGQVHEPKNGRELVEALHDGPEATMTLVRNDVIGALRDHAKMAEGLLGESKSSSA